MNLCRFLLAGVALAVAAAGCAAGRGPGEACAETEDCRPELACFEGKCALPGTCPSDAPVSCGATLPDQCCPLTHSVCCATDGMCHATAADCGDGGCSNRECSTADGCCEGFTCGRYTRRCRAAKYLGIGEACTEDGQCTSRSCYSFCTRACTTTATCGSANYCLDTLFGFRCIPFCRTNADCAIYGRDMTCQKGTDPSGLELPGCFPR